MTASFAATACIECGDLPNRVDDPYCSDACRDQALGSALLSPDTTDDELVALADRSVKPVVVEQARPRVVRLVVIQTAAERRADGRILADNPMPRTRAECEPRPGEAAQRPCPHVKCSMHLYLEVLPNGAIRYNFPGLEPWELPETCALDLAERGGITLEEIGRYINLTRERVRQLIEAALARAKRRANPDLPHGIDLEDWNNLEAPTHALGEVE